MSKVLITQSLCNTEASTPPGCPVFWDLAVVPVIPAEFWQLTWAV